MSSISLPLFTSSWQSLNGIISLWTGPPAGCPATFFFPSTSSNVVSVTLLFVQWYHLAVFLFSVHIHAGCCTLWTFWPTSLWCAAWLPFFPLLSLSGFKGFLHLPVDILWSSTQESSFAYPIVYLEERHPRLLEMGLCKSWLQESLKGHLIKCIDWTAGSCGKQIVLGVYLTSPAEILFIFLAYKFYSAAATEHWVSWVSKTVTHR